MLKVMTFNIRYDNPADGENGWVFRRDRVAEMLREQQADVIGLQEALRGQIAYLAERLPEHDWYGLGREDGREQGEFVPIFYRRERFRRLDAGAFWLSPTPELPGSTGWDASVPRIATWVRLVDRFTEQRLLAVNTHLDYRGVHAREESARLLLCRIGSMTEGDPVVLTGDFNCTPVSTPHHILMGRDEADKPPGREPSASESLSEKGDRHPPSYGSRGLNTQHPGASPPFRRDSDFCFADARTASATGHRGPDSTWNGFLEIVPNRQLDFIFVAGPIQVRSHAILDDHRDGRFPSDHLPVVAELVVHP